MARVNDQRYPIPVYQVVVPADVAATTVTGSVPVKTTGITNSSLVAKGAPGSLVGFNAYTSAACFLVFINATAVPVGGAAIDPLKFFAIPANGTIVQDWNIPIRFGTGIVALLTTSLTTYTASATGSISAEVR